MPRNEDMSKFGGRRQKNGGSIIEESRIIDELLGSDWMSKEHNLANNNDRLGERGSNIGYASILQGKSSPFIGRSTFRKSASNFFRIQMMSFDLVQRFTK